MLGSFSYFGKLFSLFIFFPSKKGALWKIHERRKYNSREKKTVFDLFDQCLMIVKRKIEIETDRCKIEKIFS